MTNRNYGFISFVILAVISLISCGGSGGAPGSDFGSTGMQPTGPSLTVTSPDIETFQCADCCNGEPEPALTREDATLNVNMVNLTPEITAAHFPASIESCTITYLKADEDPAAPIIESWTIFPNCVLTEGANSCVVSLIDIDRKLQYSFPVYVNQTHIPAEIPTHYVARLNCKYVTNFGKTGYFPAEIDLWLADFIKC